MDYQHLYTYGRAWFALHTARLRDSLRDGDRGASAVELAFITAGLLIVAALIYAAIHEFVNKESSTIKSNTGP